MKKFLKYLLYLIACIAVFLLLAKYLSSSSNQASAFEWEKSVNIYFGNSKMGSNEDCSKVFPVARTILNAETLGPGALEALLKGASESEKESGYISSVNNGVLVQQFEIKDGVAYVDFNSRFGEGMGGSCRVQAIRSQIENTLNNLPDIDSVVISVNGQTEGILEP